LIAGCAAAAALLTAYEVGATAIGIGQRNQHQDAADAQVEEIKRLRADLRRSGVAQPPEPVLSSSETARAQELVEREPKPPTLGQRIWRMLP